MLQQSGKFLSTPKLVHLPPQEYLGEVPGCSAYRSFSFGGLCSGTAIAPVHRHIQRGENLYGSGEHFKALYSIRSGFFKTLIYSEDGREQVTGFQMGGDVLGLDGVGTCAHTNTAVALESSQVCVFPFEWIEAMALQSPQLNLSFQNLLGVEIQRNHRLMLMLGCMRAEERVAAFLVDLLSRLRTRGWSGSDTLLRMTRQEIGSYLGLTLETVSRAFSDLAAQGIIEINLRHVVVLDPIRLARLSNSEPDWVGQDAAKPRLGTVVFHHNQPATRLYN
ncbi:MAG: helix-turn-helix domain-containing protein [Pseudomonadota bacterium]